MVGRSSINQPSDTHDREPTRAVTAHPCPHHTLPGEPPNPIPTTHLAISTTASASWTFRARSASLARRTRSSSSADKGPPDAVAACNAAAGSSCSSSSCSSGASSPSPPAAAAPASSSPFSAQYFSSRARTRRARFLALVLVLVRGGALASVPAGALD